MKIDKYDKDLQNIFFFSFDNFSEFYQKKLRFIINREQEDDKENFSKIKSSNRLYKKYKRNNFFLSQNILNIYITFTNNNLKELLNTFKLKKCEYKEEKETDNNNISNNMDIERILKKEQLPVNPKVIKDERIDNFYLVKKNLK